MLIDSKRLRYFVIVAEELHFGRAAKRLHMAQQPLSAQIQLLEQEIECQLFERKANRTILTAAGTVLFKEAQAIIERTEAALALTRRAARGEVGLLRIGHCSAALNDVLPNAIRKLKERFPAVGVQLRELGWVEQLELLARGEIDVGFTYREAIDQRSFMTLDMHECGFVVALPAGHILANLHRVSIERLANEPYVAIAAKFNACAHINVQMLGENMSAPAFEVDDKLSALGLVANGLGFTIIPEIAVIPYPNVAFRSLDTLQSIHLAGIWTHEAGTLIRQHFIDALRPLAAASNLETAQSTPL